MMSGQAVQENLLPQPTGFLEFRSALLVEYRPPLLPPPPGGQPTKGQLATPPGEEVLAALKNHPNPIFHQL